MHSPRLVVLVLALAAPAAGSAQLGPTPFHFDGGAVQPGSDGWFNAVFSARATSGIHFVASAIQDGNPGSTPAIAIPDAVIRTIGERSRTLRVLPAAWDGAGPLRLTVGRPTQLEQPAAPPSQQGETVGGTPSEQSPVEQAPSAESPVTEMPVTEMPVAEDPVQETPVEEPGRAEEGPTQVVPEPVTVVLLLTGLALVGLVTLRTRRRV